MLRACMFRHKACGCAEALSAAAHHGFDPTLGIFYLDLAPGRESLACDLVEPVRPEIDGFAQNLFEKILRPEDFSGRGAGGCTMGKAARRECYRAFAESCAPTLRETLDAVAAELAARLREKSAARPAARLLACAPDDDQPDGAG